MKIVKAELFSGEGDPPFEFMISREEVERMGADFIPDWLRDRVLNAFDASEEIENDAALLIETGENRRELVAMWTALSEDADVSISFIPVECIELVSFQ